MSLATSRLAPEQLGSTRWIGAISGALSGAAAAILAMTVFFPVGRLFDPSVGGTPRGSLASDLLLGFVGGVLISPVGAGIGALVGHRLQLRQLRPTHLAGLIMLSAGIGFGIFAALNGGLIDDRGSTDSLQFVMALSALAWFVAVVAYSVVRYAFLDAARKPSNSRT